MPSAPPEGEPVPGDGALPPEALATLGTRPLGLYLHVPFCAHRCGYCDFNTYVDSGDGFPVFVDAARAEVRLARAVLGAAERPVPPVATVFLGGGTPTLLPPADLSRLLDAVRADLGLAADAEVTVEANPETVGPVELAALRAAGVTRLSLGMQSARPHVLSVLERRHTPGRPQAVVREARAAGFDHVSLDLIYGTAGESLDDWRVSLEAAVSADPDHVSAYALVVEAGTRLAVQVARGEVAAPDDDDLADKYELADDMLTAAGYAWYEVSNWARPGGECRHNLLYWTGADWWGVGPGAHSHVGGVRWWNVRLPATYADRLASGSSPAQARERLSAADRAAEDILLRLRLASGLPLGGLSARARAAARRAATDGLLERRAYTGGLAVLTRRGRLLADAVVRELVD